MKPFPRDQPLGPYYRFAAVVLWPAMMSLTRQDWRGTRHLGRPGQGCVIAPNHVSWFDPIVIAHFMNDNDRVPRFLAKDAIFDFPVVGRIVGGAGQIPVYRETENATDAVRSAVAAVAEGEAVVVYPEGTLTRDPDLWPMTGKTGAARIALLSRRPVVPVAHWGAQDVMRPYTKEFRAFPPKTMHVAAGAPVDLSDLEDLELTTDVLAEATSRIVDAITELLATLRGESPPEGRWNPKAGRREPVRHPLPREQKGPIDMAARKSNPASSAKDLADTAKKAVTTRAAAARKTVEERTTAAEKSVAKAADTARKTVAKRVSDAEKAVAKSASAARKAVVEATPAGKKAVAKKAAPVKKVAKKTPAAKRATAAKKTTAKKVTPAKKTTARKATAAKKTTAKKATAAKKTTAKKATTAKKTTAKKATAAKKTTAKKATTAKKTTAAKKTTGKRTAARTAKRS